MASVQARASLPSAVNADVPVGLGSTIRVRDPGHGNPRIVSCVPRPLAEPLRFGSLYALEVKPNTSYVSQFGDMVLKGPQSAPSPAKYVRSPYAVEFRQDISYVHLFGDLELLALAGRWSRLTRWKRSFCTYAGSCFGIVYPVVPVITELLLTWISPAIFLWGSVLASVSIRAVGSCFGSVYPAVVRIFSHTWKGLIFVWVLILAAVSLTWTNLAIYIWVPVLVSTGSAAIVYQILAIWAGFEAQQSEVVALRQEFRAYRLSQGEKFEALRLKSISQERELMAYRLSQDEKLEALRLTQDAKGSMFLEQLQGLQDCSSTMQEQLILFKGRFEAILNELASLTGLTSENAAYASELLGDILRLTGLVARLRDTIRQSDLSAVPNLIGRLDFLESELSGLGHFVGQVNRGQEQANSGLQQVNLRDQRREQSRSQISTAILAITSSNVRASDLFESRSRATSDEFDNKMIAAIGCLAYVLRQIYTHLWPAPVSNWHHPSQPGPHFVPSQQGGQQQTFFPAGQQPQLGGPQQQQAFFPSGQPPQQGSLQQQTLFPAGQSPQSGGPQQQTFFPPGRFGGQNQQRR